MFGGLVAQREFMYAWLERYNDNVNATNARGTTILMWASANGCQAAVVTLLKKDVDVDQKSSLGNTALMRAACFGHPGVVRLLLQARAQTGLRNTSGDTALQMAEHMDHTECVQVLKEHMDRVLASGIADCSWEDAPSVIDYSQKEIPCVVCLVSDKTHVLIPCGHRCVCAVCAHVVTREDLKCPVCRAKCVACWKVYL